MDGWVGGMMSRGSEEVLAVARERLPRGWLGEKTWMVVSEEKLRAVGDLLPLCWLQRRQAENDPSFKQIIPYVVVQRDGGKETGCYCRKGSEARLHDRWSVGIGGHISRVDHAGGPLNLLSLATRGLERELYEELGIRVGGAGPTFAGIINEEVTEVGQVHIGLVYCLALETDQETRPDAELHAFSWRKPADIPREQLELWSQLALGLLEGPARFAPDGKSVHKNAKVEYHNQKPIEHG